MSNIRTNTFDQPIGAAVDGWTARSRPPATPMQGRFCSVVPLDPAAHCEHLFAADMLDPDGANWTYSLGELPGDVAAYRSYLDTIAAKDDPMFHTIIEQASGEAVGIASLMRIDPANGVIEVGNIRYSPRLQRRPAATEAMFLMMCRVFDELGYRRYEWKCDALNAPSRAAALRLGFRFEGIFRQAVVYKNRNRDTAWFSIIDSEWPALKAAFEAWLHPDNFDDAGMQRRSLGDLTSSANRE